jgi:hypothetical protein
MASAPKLPLRPRLRRIGGAAVTAACRHWGQFVPNVVWRNQCGGAAFVLHRRISLGGDIVRMRLATLALVSSFGLTAPALADVGPGGSLQQAIAIARDFGVVGFQQVQYYDGKWEIEGRDPRGKTINMDVDAMTGAVMKVDRY